MSDTALRRARRLAGVLALAVLAAPALAQTAAERPNVIVVLADDLGWADVGFHGSDIETPTLDALAAGGLVFDQFYAQSMCTPTRAALLTGRYPFRYGLQTAVIPSGGTYGLDPAETTLADALGAAGYDTALVGKWHLGHADAAYWPTARGFRTAYGPLIGEIDHFTHSSHGVKDWFRDGVALDEPGYDTHLLADEAVRLIESGDLAEPFLLYLAFTAPHTPYQAPDETLARYADIADPQRRAYAAQVTEMDAALGRVVAALEAKGLRDETLILFASDNGGTRSAIFAGEAAVSGELPPNNGPYREGKGTLYEGGSRVVAFANWPGVLEPGVVADPVHVVDVFPTLLGLTGAQAPAAPLDGVDQWAAWTTEAPGPRDEIVYGVEPFRAGIRQGDYKLIWGPVLPPRVELYDIARDPGETRNLAAELPDTVALLQGRAIELSQEAKPPLFLGAMVKLGLNDLPAFPDGDVSRIGEGTD